MNSQEVAKVFESKGFGIDIRTQGRVTGHRSTKKGIGAIAKAEFGPTRGSCTVSFRKKTRDFVFTDADSLAQGLAPKKKKAAAKKPALKKEKGNKVSTPKKTEIYISNTAKDVLKKAGIAEKDVKGTGDSGSITVRDARAAAAAKAK